LQLWLGLSGRPGGDPEFWFKQLRSLRTDYLIIGAGIVGLTIAREIKLRVPGASVILLEKEDRPGRHSSGRNSGVLHSGIYDQPGTAKARLCAEGAREMAAYCKKHRLPLNRIGKLLLAVSPEEVAQLDLLECRGAANGVEAHRVDGAALRALEPEARSTGQALFVPSTSVVSPMAVIEQLIDEIGKLGVTLQCGGHLASVHPRTAYVQWAGTSISYGHVVNAAGLHADSVAHLFGAGRRYAMLPFKGIYWKIRSDAHFQLRHLIYPVPDLRVPFLGVHTTTALDGATYIGPSAIPAFGRENYRGLRGANFNEGASILKHLLTQFTLGHDGFRRLAWQEGSRAMKWRFVKAANRLLPRLRASHLQACDKVGIRAQLLDLENRRLVQDFLIETRHNSTHVLNAVSPAFTSAFPLARHICDHHVPT
jgi:(S)-2-hydroxyglutarate dehydrogenase